MTEPTPRPHNVMWAARLLLINSGVPVSPVDPGPWSRPIPRTPEEQDAWRVRSFLRSEGLIHPA